jgi:GntR family transcriptional regulator
MINHLFSSDAPIYKQIKEIIKTRITEGIYSVNSLIPGENDLAKEFGVSRVSIRAALEILKRDGYINRRPGYGTYVCFADPNLNKFTSLKSFTSEMREMGYQSLTFKSEIQTIEADGQLASIFHCEIGTPIYLLKRLRGDENSPIVYSYTYLNLEIRLPSDDEFLYGSLYAYLIRNGISFARMKESIEAVFPQQHIYDELRMARNQPILRRTRLSYDRNDNILEYTINHYNAEHYKYTIEINSINPEK